MNRAIRPSEPARILSAIKSIKPGQVVVYHHGDLVYDRIRNRQIDAIGSEIYCRYKDGKIILLRSRVGTNTFDYLAMGVASAASKSATKPPFSHPHIL